MSKDGKDYYATPQMYLVCGIHAYVDHVGPERKISVIREVYKDGALVVCLEELESKYERRMTELELINLEKALRAPRERLVEETKKKEAELKAVKQCKHLSSQ